ncbi:MAG: Smr/MutS family protein [Pseudomonadota bacterium]
MSKDREPPASPDDGLFRQALDGVTPLPPSDRATIKPATKYPHQAVAAGPITPVIHDSLSDHGMPEHTLTEFMRSGVSRMTLRKLRRGYWPTQDSLDLHGLSSNEARQLLVEFLYGASRAGLRCVSVIHGKGGHSGGEGILKIRARHWLTQCPEVLAFCEPAANEGGGGAVKVLLKTAD